jgi:hypothetical protein
MIDLPLVFASIWNNSLWYAVPLVIVVSLVYAATRHELMGPILEHAARMAAWIVGFMIVVFVVLAIISWWV